MTSTHVMSHSNTDVSMWYSFLIYDSWKERAQNKDFEAGSLFGRGSQETSVKEQGERPKRKKRYHM